MLDQIRGMSNDKLIDLQHELQESICKKLTEKEQLALNILLEVSHELTLREDA